MSRSSPLRQSTRWTAPVVIASRSWVPLAVARWCARHGGCALVITRSSPGHVDDQLGGTAVDHPQQLFADLAGIAVAHVLRKSQDRAPSGLPHRVAVMHGFCAPPSRAAVNRLVLLQRQITRLPARCHVWTGGSGLPRHITTPPCAVRQRHHPNLGKGRSALHPGQHRRYRPARRACFHQDNRGRLSTATESCATPARPELLQLHLQHHRIGDLGHVERHETQQRQRSKGRFL
jgi:hypothetical protein